VFLTNHYKFFHDLIWIELSSVMYGCESCDYNRCTTILTLPWFLHGFLSFLVKFVIIVIVFIMQLYLERKEAWWGHASISHAPSAKELLCVINTGRLCCTQLTMEWSNSIMLHSLKYDSFEIFLCIFFYKTIPIIKLQLLPQFVKYSKVKN
jgi:hypothetical protein